MVSRPAEVQILVNPDPADTNPPEIQWTYPEQGAIIENLERTPIDEDDEGPVYSPFVSASFSESIEPSTLDDGSFRVEEETTGRVLASTVRWDESLQRAILVDATPDIREQLYRLNQDAPDGEYKLGGVFLDVSEIDVLQGHHFVRKWVPQGKLVGQAIGGQHSRIDLVRLGPTAL